jgi:hypothetical protein
MPKSVDYNRISKINISGYTESDIKKNDNSKFANISKISNDNIYLFSNKSKSRSNYNTLDSSNTMSMSSSHSNYNYVP